MSSESHSEVTRVMVLAGGSSSRFFPLNKVLSDPTGSGKTMIQQTQDRATNSRLAVSPAIVDPQAFYVVSSEQMAPLLRHQLPEVPPANVLVEPARRNTLPAILWTVAHIRAQTNEHALVAMLTSDHIIGEPDLFRHTLRTALKTAAEAPRIVTIGICPNDNPEDWRSFGAMQGERVEDGPIPLTSFEEKPSHESAERMIEQGNWFWNAGMFMFRISSLEQGLRLTNPDIFALYEEMCEAVAAGRIQRSPFAQSESRSATEIFLSFPSKIHHPCEDRMVDHSIDYALMMPLTRREYPVKTYVVPGHFKWTDIGNWDALYSVKQPDEDGNLVIGSQARAIGCERCIVYSEASIPLIVRNLKDSVIVRSKEGVLFVCSFDQLGEIRDVYRQFHSPEREEGSNIISACQEVIVQGRNVVLVGQEHISVQNTEASSSVEHTTS